MKGEFTEGHELDRKWRMPQAMVGRRLIDRHDLHHPPDHSSRPSTRNLLARRRNPQSITHQSNAGMIALAINLAGWSKWLLKRNSCFAFSDQKSPVAPT